jgi:hypothetical protein
MAWRASVGGWLAYSQEGHERDDDGQRQVEAPEVRPAEDVHHLHPPQQHPHLTSVHPPQHSSATHFASAWVGLPGTRCRRAPTRAAPTWTTDPSSASPSAAQARRPWERVRPASGRLRLVGYGGAFWPLPVRWRRRRRRRRARIRATRSTPPKSPRTSPKSRARNRTNHLIGNRQYTTRQQPQYPPNERIRLDALPCPSGPTHPPTHPLTGEGDSGGHLGQAQAQAHVAYRDEHARDQPAPEARRERHIP